jgi:tetratricopeptide (TPR) repeat protein
VSKWARRHQNVVLATSAGLLVAVAALTVSTIWAWHKQRETEDALQAAVEQRRTADANAEDAQRQRQRADETFRQAIGTVGELMQRMAKSQSLDELRTGQSAEALKFFERAIAENRSDLEGRLQAATAYRGMGHTLLARSEFTKAAEAYASALAIVRNLRTDAPADPRPGKLWSDLLVETNGLVVLATQDGDSATGERRCDEAVKCYREALSILERFPDFDQPWQSPIEKSRRKEKAFRRLAYALWASNQLEEADRAATEALAVAAAWAAADPTTNKLALRWRAISREYRGLIRVESGRLAEAESDFRAVLDFWEQPHQDRLFAFRRVPVRSELGKLLWATGRREEASALFGQAEQEWRKTSNQPRGRDALGWFWFLAACPDERFRKPKEAIELAEKAIEGSPKLGVLWRTLGVARYRAGDDRGAVTALEKSLELGVNGWGYRTRPDSSEWFFLAMAHWRLGDKEQARKWYDKAVEWTDKNRPGDPELRRFREEAAEVLGVGQK